MIEEGKMSDRIARILSLGIKRKIVTIGNQIRSSSDIEEKIDLMSKQNSALAALILTGISVGGEGLLSKGQILSSLFSEEYGDVLRTELVKEWRDCEATSGN